jgi:hypothetical protein
MKRFVGCIIGLFVLAGGLLAAPADATSMCPDFTLCVWENVNRVPQLVEISNRRGVSNKLARLMNNKASSVENDTGFVAFLYKKRDGKGARICLTPGAIQDDLGLLSFEDVASSTRVTRRSVCPT